MLGYYFYKLCIFEWWKKEKNRKRQGKIPRQQLKLRNSRVSPSKINAFFRLSKGQYYLLTIALIECLKEDPTSADGTLDVDNQNKLIHNYQDK